MPSSAPKPAKPRIGSNFDPFNSSTTGHQRAENRLGGSTSWRQSRSRKLQNQFNSGASGGKRLSDTVGAGSLDFGEDGRTANRGWENGAAGLRKGGQRSIFDGKAGVTINEDVERTTKRVKTGKPVDREPTRVTNPFTPFRKEDGSIRATSWTSHETSPSALLSPIDPNDSSPTTYDYEEQHDSEISKKDEPKPQIFANLVLYVNGFCGPDISDHKLKRLWSQYGGKTSIHLARRAVTHVMIGRPSSSGGSGGGLAGSKIQKEVTKKRGSAVKYVTAEWVTRSIEAGKRLPESRYAPLSFAPNGVASVARMFGDKQRTDSPTQVDER